MKKELYNDFYLKIIDERKKSDKHVLCFIINYFDEYKKDNIKMIDNLLLLIIQNIKEFAISELLCILTSTIQYKNNLEYRNIFYLNIKKYISLNHPEKETNEMLIGLK